MHLWHLGIPSGKISIPCSCWMVLKDNKSSSKLTISESENSQKCRSSLFVLVINKFGDFWEGLSWSDCSIYLGKMFLVMFFRSFLLFHFPRCLLAYITWEIERHFSFKSSFANWGTIILSLDIPGKPFYSSLQFHFVPLFWSVIRFLWGVCTKEFHWGRMNLSASFSISCLIIPTFVFTVLIIIELTFSVNHLQRILDLPPKWWNLICSQLLCLFI